MNLRKILTLLAIANPVFAAPALVSAAGACFPSGSPSVTLDTRGATLIVIHRSTESCGGALVDSVGGNTYVEYQGSVNNGFCRQSGYYAGPATGASHTIGANSTGGSGNCIFVAAFSGIVATSPLGASTTANSLTTGSINPTPDVGDLFVAFGSSAVGVSFTGIDQSFTGFSHNESGGHVIGFAYFVDPATTTKAPTFTWTGTCCNMTHLATFKAGAAPTAITRRFVGMGK